MQKTIHTLSQLLAPWLQIKAQYDCDITSICGDSREVQIGEVLIFAITDPNQQHAYIEQAQAKKVSAIIIQGEQYQQQLLANTSIVLITFPHLAREIGNIAAHYFNNTQENLHVTGVTGTNGKTSVSHFIAQILHQHQTASGIIGTLGNGFPWQLHASDFTTPDAITTHRLLAQLRAQGAKNIIMEVSSHALTQYRVIGVPFSSAIFTNLTRDHLDYHGSMESYGAAKTRLFTDFALKTAIINLDDPHGLELAARMSPSVTVYGYSQQRFYDILPEQQQLVASTVQLSHAGMSAQITTPWGSGILHSHLLGRFNVSNLLAVLASICSRGLDFSTALDSIANLRNVPGRMQAFRIDNKPLTVVDYSHTPDALAKALIELRAHCAGKIWCVLGCGGERDRGKRPIMAQIAQTYADKIIFTDDNPRRENPQQIIDDILSGITDDTNVQVEHNRALAITKAVNQANSNDVVIVAGKGHEDYQIIGEEKHHFSDIEFVSELLNIQ